MFGSVFEIEHPRQPSSFVNTLSEQTHSGQRTGEAYPFGVKTTFIEFGPSAAAIAVVGILKPEAVR